MVFKNKSNDYSTLEKVKIITFIKPVMQWYSVVFDLIFYVLIVLITIDILILLIGTNTKISFMTSFFLSGALDSLNPGKLFHLLNLKQVWDSINRKIYRIFENRKSMMKSWSLTSSENLLINISFFAEVTGRLFVLPLCLLSFVCTSAPANEFFTQLLTYVYFMAKYI
jgi:DMSO reductase anchor subunit